MKNRIKLTQNKYAVVDSDSFGYYKTPIEAAEAYNRGVKALVPNFALLNETGDIK
jgi:hypothetical protein